MSAASTAASTRRSHRGSTGAAAAGPRSRLAGRVFVVFLSTAAAAQHRRSSPPPDSDFGGVLFTVATYVAGGARPQHRRRLRRPARPRLRRLLRRRRLHGGRPQLGARQAVPCLLVRADRDGRGTDLGRPPRRADAAGARRLPRHRDARLRRDRPADPGQHGVARRRPRASPTSPGRPASSLFEIPHLDWAAVPPFVDLDDHDHVPEVRRQPT